ncbi:biotin synthase, partial [Vibrio parahaemolyticus]
MMLLVTFVALFVSLFFLIFDSLRTEQRRKKAALYIGEDTVRTPSRMNQLFVR